MNDDRGDLYEQCWRVGRASRLGVLVDGSNYFAALREAMLAARRSIFVVGWDIDSRTLLVGENTEPDDGMPAKLGEFLAELVSRNEDLEIRLLLWDYSMIYAAEREVLPTVALGWRTPARIEFCLDDELPIGASHHHKLVVVDDCIAFIGGLDLTIRRWDTPAHRPSDERRIDPDGEPYEPFHDIQAVVDGTPAAAIAEFCRDRWEQAARETMGEVQHTADPWPESVEPLLTDVDIGIARTLAAYGNRAEAREIEAVYLEAIGAAQRVIYIENQYLTAEAVAAALIDRLKNNRQLEVLCLCPRAPGGWLEAKTMGSGRERFMARLDDAGLKDRVSFLEPVVGSKNDETPVKVHAKLMIVDDRFCTLGSANLNNRSMGFDTECNLVIQATDDNQRTALWRLRSCLLAEHCGTSTDDIDAALEAGGNLADRLLEITGKGRRLSRIQYRQELDDEFARSISDIADPEAPFEIEKVLGDGFGGRVESPLRRRIAGIVGGLAVVGAAIAAWRFTPLAGWLDAGRIAAVLEGSTSDPTTALLLLGIFVAGGFLLFPVTVLIAASALLLGPWSGLLTATAGVLLSAAITFLAGERMNALTRRFVPVSMRAKLRSLVEQRGIMAVAIVRNVPIAPFTVVNLLAAQTGIGLLPFLIGTLLGMLPGIAVLTYLGDRLRAILENPSAGSIALLVAAIVVWIGVALLLQKVANRYRETPD